MPLKALERDPDDESKEPTISMDLKKSQEGH